MLMFLLLPMTATATTMTVEGGRGLLAFCTPLFMSVCLLMCLVGWLAGWLASWLRDKLIV
jgi:NhaP-type Na+/H+ or K+/H+ antiporter